MYHQRKDYVCMCVYVNTIGLISGVPLVELQVHMCCVH